MTYLRRCRSPIAAVPGGGLWAVGVQANKANTSAHVEFPC
jgi:hypothetical protein